MVSGRPCLDMKTLASPQIASAFNRSKTTETSQRKRFALLQAAAAANAGLLSFVIPNSILLAAL